MKYSSQWLTLAERSGFKNTPGYKDSIKYFNLFAQKTSYAKMISIGSSPQGRPINCLVISNAKEFTPQKAKLSGKAIVLIQNCIHAGEVEGKDACMMLLRDMLVTKEKFNLLDNIILLVLPILNVDGHERKSACNRPNQNGPAEMGWRTNSLNLNLNRDYMKADSIEIQSFLKLFSDWLPDFFIDNHTTNGADYQYHITYSLEKWENIDANLSKWGTTKFLPYLISRVEENGFLTAPYIESKTTNILDGIVDSAALPRLSTGYAAVQNRLGLLVETHSLKPYENRVRSTFTLNMAAIEFINTHYKTLKKINATADSVASKIKFIPIQFKTDEISNSFLFKGFKASVKQSSITGNEVVHFSNSKEIIELPYFNVIRSLKVVKVPWAYIIPKEYQEIVKKLILHGIQVEKLNFPKNYKAEEYFFSKYRFSAKPYEGRQCVNVDCRAELKSVIFPKGTFLVKTSQRTKRVIVNLLEPESPDSFVSWGFFNAWFERKEYAEPYILEPIALEMLKMDKKLGKYFNDSLKDDTFKMDPLARLNFFYERSPYIDQKEKIYPIYRLIQNN